MAPASPKAPKFLPGKKLYVAISPKVPVFLSFIFAPCDCAESSIIHMLFFFIKFEIFSTSNAKPYKCTPIIPTDSLEILSVTLSRDICQLSLSTSINFTSFPILGIIDAEAT